MTPQDLVARVIAAFNARDAAALASLFAEDGMFVTTAGQAMHGRAAIAATFGKIFATVFVGLRADVAATDIATFGDDLVAMHATWSRARTGDATASSLAPASGVFSLVAQRSPGTGAWLLVSAANVLSNPQLVPLT
jgi:uncharacterized protein (TIGR02246 family)